MDKFPPKDEWGPREARGLWMGSGVGIAYVCERIWCFGFLCKTLTQSVAYMLWSGQIEQWTTICRPDPTRPHRRQSKSRLICTYQRLRSIFNPLIQALEWQNLANFIHPIPLNGGLSRPDLHANHNPSEPTHPYPPHPQSLPSKMGKSLPPRHVTATAPEFGRMRGE